MPTFDKLAEKAIEILDADFVMPIDEIRMGTAFSKLPKPAEVAVKLMSTLFQHDNFHVRRVAVQAWRRIGDPNVPGLREALMQALIDAEGWVRYDAAWAIRVLGYKDQKMLDALAVVASGAIYPKDEAELNAQLSNSKSRARFEAAQAIYDLSTRAV